jgi:hypothetical protein
VRGSEDYSLILQWAGKRLEVLCDCAFLIGNDQPRKHLWAMLLAVDAAQHLSLVAGEKSLVIDTSAILEQSTIRTTWLFTTD